MVGKATLLIFGIVAIGWFGKSQAEGKNSIKP